MRHSKPILSFAPLSEGADKALAKGGPNGIGAETGGFSFMSAAMAVIVRQIRPATGQLLPGQVCRWPSLAALHPALKARDSAGLQAPALCRGIGTFPALSLSGALR